MPHFLIEYDRPRGSLTDLVEYPDDAQPQAMADLRRREADKPSHVEVVLLSARSREDIERTHSRYFKTAAEIAASLGAD